VDFSFLPYPHYGRVLVTFEIGGACLYRLFFRHVGELLAYLLVTILVFLRLACICQFFLRSIIDDELLSLLIFRRGLWVNLCTEIENAFELSE